MKIIPFNALQGVFKMLSKNIEMCGLLIQSGKPSKYTEFFPYVDAVGQESKDGKNMCINPRYGYYIWHTHSFTMKGYPSTEDILKIIKLRNLPFQIKASFIFTSWGIWELSTYGKVKLSKEMKNYLLNKLNPVWYGIYQISNKGRNLPPRANQFVQGIITQITTYLNQKFNRANLDLKIYFTPWNNIGNKGYFIQTK